MTEARPFSGWAICEQMGHRRLAGYVRADGDLLTATRLVIDVYDGDAVQPSATIGTGYPVYQLTPCTEELARRLGRDTLRTDMPVTVWDARRLLPQPEVSPAAIEAPDAGAVVAHDPDCDDAECEGCGPRASAGAPF